MSKSPKKKASSSSLVASSPGHSPKKEASSVAGVSESPEESKKNLISLWPEWSDNEVNAEKWDASKASKDSRLFDDPEGKVELPASLRVHTWKRPSEFILNKTPVVVGNEDTFDLSSANEHLLSSELMRWVISECYILWKVCNTAEDKAVSTETVPSLWRPWEHIYSLCKASKDHLPLYNAYGKYVIKLYWMGNWRKITIDDTLPFDKDDNLLLPATTNQSELWPMLLAKGILKVANIDTSASGSGREFGEFTVIHCLTGWIPEIIPLKSWYTGKIWEFLRDSIPQFHLEDESSEEKTMTADLTASDSNVNEIKSESPTAPKSSESAKRKSTDSDKDRKTILLNAAPNKTTGPVPQMVVCASYQPLHLMEKRTSVLTRMADSSESLRQYGLSQLFSHPVLLTCTRDCPLVAPSNAPPVPQLKHIRARKQTNITDEPKEPPVQKPEQFIEVSSPFINFRLMTMAAHDTEHGSVKKRGFNSNLTSFSEMDDSEDDHAQNDITPNSLKSLENTETTQVTAEDKKKDDSIANGEESTSGPDKDTDGKDKEKVQTAKESTAVLLQSQDAIASDKPLLLETWVDLHNFTKCFQTLLIFHKPNTYTHQCKTSHFKNSISSRLSAATLSNAVASTHSVAAPARQPDLTGIVHTQSADGKGTYFLYVDNLLPTEIVIGFSTLVHWGESVDEKKEFSIRPGSLTAKSFSWKSIVCELPVLQIQTTTSKAALLSLPSGRHVLHLHTSASLAVHLHLCSMSPFVFGDEETVMPHLDKESMRFCEQAVMIVRSLGRVISCFSDPEKLPSTTKELEKTHGVDIQQQRVFNEAVYHMFCSALGRKLTSEELFAVQTLTGDPLPHGNNDKAMDSRSEDTPERWNGRQATDKEMQAATVLQAGWKGYLIREILTAARPGTKENLSVTKTLQEMWAPVESDVEEHAVSLLRHMVDNGEGIAELYPCREDECNRITFADYSVPVPETANSWILIFREVFHVPKNMLLVPKIFSPLPVCIVHVIDNDTLEEIPRVFNMVEPYKYTPNKCGYMFVAEAHTGETPVIGGKWRMRLIGSREPLPQLARETPSNNFLVNELKGYYVPNQKNIICRHVVKVSSDLSATVQFQTSKSDVYIKLIVLDHEKEVASSEGKGHVVIPVYCFLASGSGSSVAQAGAKQDQGSLTAEGGVTGGGGGKEGSDQHPTDILFHNYYIQAEVLQESWSLDESLLSFIQNLKDIERNEMRVFGDILEGKSTPVGAEQQNKEGQKSASKSTHKAKEREKDKDKLTSKSTSILSLDVSKPHWTLRVVSDQSEAGNIEVKKDTEKLEEIRAMKLAWEAAEPGRAAKAYQSRLLYLKELQERAESKEPVTADADTQPQSQQSGEFTQNFNKISNDYTPFIRKSLPQPRLKGEEVEEEQRRERSEKFQSFRLIWDNILEQRKQEKIARTEMMKRQLETYIGFQDTMDAYRQKMLQTCEAFYSHTQKDKPHKTMEEPMETVEQVEIEKVPTGGRKSGGKRK